MLLSLAGIPITAGFIGKFYIVAAGAASSIWALLVVLAVTSAIGLFYYLRVIVTLYGDGGEEAAVTHGAGLAGGIALSILTAALLLFGVFPAPLLDTIRTVISDLT